MKQHINNSVRGAALSLGVDANLLYELLPYLRDGVSLAAENERLRKAGEKMADIVWNIRTPEAHEALHDWNAAKEGRDAK